MRILLLAAFSLVLYSCSDNSQNSRQAPAGEAPSGEQVAEKPSAGTADPEERPAEEKASFRLEPFTRIPKEIDGCSCTFHASRQEEKAGNYLLVSDFASIAFVSIDGKMEKFALKQHQENSKSYRYANGAYTLELEITKEEYGEEESSVLEGVMTLSKGKEVLRRRFVGTCGC